jgi:hypothetical protein
MNHLDTLRLAIEKAGWRLSFPVHTEAEFVPSASPYQLLFEALFGRQATQENRRRECLLSQGLVSGEGTSRFRRRSRLHGEEGPPRTRPALNALLGRQGGHPC